MNALLPKEFLPKTVIVNPSTKTFDETVHELTSNQFNFPVVCKPDIGDRGYNVKKIDTVEQLMQYFISSHRCFLIQQFVDAEYEFGFLLLRKPREGCAKIISLSRRGFLQIYGDGINTISYLLNREQNVLKYASSFQYQIDEKCVPKLNEKVNLTFQASLSRGSKIFDICNEISTNLQAHMDFICKEIDANIFRVDIKANSLNDILNSEFKIIEVNGVSGIPLHTLDEKYSLISTYSQLMKFMKTVYSVSQTNKKIGFKSVPLFACVRELRLHLNRSRSISIS